MSQQTNITFRVSGDEASPQGMSLSLENYLSSSDTIADRLQKGPGDTLGRLLKLKDDLDRLADAVANVRPEDAPKEER